MYKHADSSNSKWIDSQERRGGCARAHLTTGIRLLRLHFPNNGQVALKFMADSTAETKWLPMNWLWFDDITCYSIRLDCIHVIRGEGEAVNQQFQIGKLTCALNSPSQSHSCIPLGEQLLSNRPHFIWIIWI